MREVEQGSRCCGGGGRREREGQRKAGLSGRDEAAV